ncbi:MAG: hypothetical protein ACLGHL_11210 [Actinomycetota bacterium]
MRLRFLPLALIVILAPACSREVTQFETPDVAGPPLVQMDVAREHARQFDGDVPEREGGSQEEQAAAAYLTGTLQQNGYFVRLDAVPVADVVRSTNLIAQPSGAPEPQVVVTLPYDTDEQHPSSGLALGVFLELSRALNVVEPHHAVHFVALGAEYSDESGGSLGSRRLARFMLDEGWDPLVIQLVDIEEGASPAVSGDRADELVRTMTAMSGPFVEFDSGSIEVDPDVFEAAGFERMLVTGDPEKLGEVLLDYLRRFTQ